MAVATAYGQTPWTTDELAALHGTAGPRAKRKQGTLDEMIVEDLAPPYIARGVRADQAANSVRHKISRWHRLFASGDPRVMQHVTRLMKVAADAAAADELERAGKRLPAGRPARKARAGRKTA